MIDVKITVPPERSSKSDCVILAISAASGRSYRDILAMLGPEKGRVKGYSRLQFGPVLRKLGFLPVKHAGLLDMASMDKRLNYVVLVRKHMLAVVRGVAVDTWHSTGRTRRRKMLELWVAPNPDGKCDTKDNHAG